MTTVTLRDAKAAFSGLVEEAMKGQFVTITRHEKPVAVLVSLEAAEAARKNLDGSRPNFGEYLMTFPGGIDFERNPSKCGTLIFDQRLPSRYRCDLEICAQ